MNKSFLLLFLFSLLLVERGGAQNSNSCGTTSYLQQQKALDPDLEQRMLQFEAEMQQLIQNKNFQKTQGIITIPVVFHIVFENASENISSKRITEQIAVLNNDFRKTNADAYKIPAVWSGTAADCEIQFCLATRDPNGNATSGITRTPTTIPSFSMDSTVKYTSRGGEDIWDRNSYLNIWVCDLDYYNKHLLGYSTYPFPNINLATDGIVLDYHAVGVTGALSPYNLGRVATHEIGHWLSLYHIWGDDGIDPSTGQPSCLESDNVGDTPNQGKETGGCPTVGTITISCNNAPNGNMWMNYMDYTYDACAYMFTTGQKVRMQSILNSERFSIQSSKGCQLVSVNEGVLEKYLNVYPNPSTGELNVTLEIIKVANLNVKIYNVFGIIILEKAYTNVFNENLSFDLSMQANGVYFIELQAENEKAMRKIVLNR